ncbi:MAG: dolichyl-phosphate beta-glucosyltransferase [Ktedonobacterales bacterium]
MNAAARPELSIVIPAYNEARRLPESFARLQAYLLKQPFLYEVIVVDDGSSDTTSAVVKAWMGRWSRLRLLQEAHRGKGAAVRAGVLAARGAWIALADADFSMPVEEFDLFTEDALGPYDIAIASREAPGARRYGEPGYRHLLGRVFNRVTQALAVPGIEDTQCGFKRMRRDVAQDLCLHQTLPGWGFDVELLYIARLRGYQLREVPISWYYMKGSRIHPIRDSVAMFRDVLTIRYNALRRRYMRRIIPLPTISEVAPLDPADPDGELSGITINALGAASMWD